MKYYATYKIEHKHIIEIDADNMADAYQKALAMDKLDVIQDYADTFPRDLSDCNSYLVNIID